mmetsp:Transcript_15539/g.36043  ORF Transcript_15539/g.36043 Transcript_15539/m.36043 type:complete len:85 (+) Transcript_15539:571-825(+)
MKSLILKHAPQQSNDYDCGCFVVHFIELFATDPPDDFSSKAALDAKLSKSWFKESDISRKREVMRDKILKLRDRAERDVAGRDA